MGRTNIGYAYKLIGVVSNDMYTLMAIILREDDILIFTMFHADDTKEIKNNILKLKYPSKN